MRKINLNWKVIFIISAVILLGVNNNTAYAVTLAAIPSAPGNLAATAASSSQIYLSWQDNSDNETGFKIERAASSSGPWSQIAAVSANVISYFNTTGLSALTTYYYQVRAYNTAGDSGYSNTASATTSNGGVHKWSQLFGGSGSDYGCAVAVDNVSGSIALTGRFSGTADFLGKFYGTADFGGGTLSCSGTDNAVVAKYKADGTHLWSKGIDGNGNTGFVSGYDVVIDAAGNVAVTGAFSGAIDFGGQTLSTAGEKDLFVAKYSMDGELLWAKQQGGNIDNGGEGIAADAGGNLLVTGFFESPDDIILAKYSPDGVLLWLKRFTGQGINLGKAVTVDDSNNIFITGTFCRTVDFGGGPLTSVRVSYPSMFVAKYSTDGEHLWSRNFGGAGETYAYDIAVDDNGNPVVTGYFYYSIDFDNQTLSVGRRNYDAFIVKLSGVDGGCLWARRFGGIGTDRGYGLSIDSSQNIVLTGSFEYTVDFGGGALTSNGSWDIFIAKYSPDGEHLWSKGFGRPAADISYSIAVNASGEVIITGNCGGSIDFGGGNLTGKGLYDSFLVKLGP